MFADRQHEACMSPFSTLILEPTGKVGVCRHKGQTYAVGDLRTHTIKEIWNGSVIRDWRREFIQNQIGICNVEMHDRRCHVGTVPVSFEKTVQFTEYQNELPKRLGLNLNGKCNLQCPMCEVWTQDNGFYDQPHIEKQVEELLPHVQEIEMLGGEPFMQKDTYKYMAKIAQLNPECRWNITTNATWTLTDTVKDHLRRIKFRQIIISVDSIIPETFAKIRYPGKLDKFLETVDSLSKFDYELKAEGKPGLFLSTNSTIQKDNWREVPELLQFGLKQGNIEPDLALLYYPAHLSILNESAEKREEILRYFVSHVPAESLSNLGRILRPLLLSLSPITRASVLSEIGNEKWQPSVRSR